MRVLIADKLATAAVEELSRIGCQVEVEADLTTDRLPERMPGVEVLVVRSTKVDAATFDAAGDLALVVRAGAGVNTIDLDAAGRHGVFVANCPGKNADAVAELAIGMLIACDRRIVDATVELRGGRWKKKEFGAARGLKGRTLGILGYGQIGRAVAERGRALGMQVLVWSRSMTAERARSDGVGYAATPAEVAAASDAVSIHLAAAAETKGLVDAAFLDAMRPGSILINTARGDVVDQAALHRAIAEKGLRVALDVFASEPAGGTAEFPDVELASRIVATPHIGASTEQASEAIAAEVVRVIDRFRETGMPANVVNIDHTGKATHVLVVRHLNRVGVLAAVLTALREADVNVEEMENTIFSGGYAASCTMRLGSEPSEETVARIRAHESVLVARLARIEGHGAGPTPG